MTMKENVILVQTTWWETILLAVSVIPMLVALIDTPVSEIAVQVIVTFLWMMIQLGPTVCTL